MEMERVSKWVCIIVIILVSMMAFLEIQATGSHDVPVPDITLVQSAVPSGAVCLDGSAPAYQFGKGRGKGSKNWLVHLEGGQWCETKEKCTKRATTNVGSSHFMEKMGFSGILSNNRTDNPNFYNWNRVYVRYCDGACFTGNVKKVIHVKDDPHVKKLHFRGARVFDAVMDHLLAQGMANASNALLSGCSAGGLAAILHCDKFRALFPPSTKVKCLSDAGYFLHMKDAAGGYQFAKTFLRLANLHKSAKNLPVSCTSKMKPPGLYVVPQTRTPVFILNSAYDTYQISNILAAGQIGPNGSWVKCQFDIGECTAPQILSLLDLRAKSIRAALTRVDNYWSRGVFINTCHTHCQSQFQPKWSGSDPHSKLNNQAIEVAVADWFYERKPVQLIDSKHGLPHWCTNDPHEPSPKNHYKWGGQ